jgi:hypothetical protein
MGESIDNRDGSANPESLKSPVVPGLDADRVNVEGVLAKNKELLAENAEFKKKLKALEDKDAQAQEAEAKKRGDYERLLTERETRLKTVEGENKLLKVGLESVSKHDVVDYDAVRLFMDKVTDDLSNLPEIIEAEKQAHPWIFKSSQTPGFIPPVPTNKDKGTPANIGKIWTRAELAGMKPGSAEFETNKAAIFEQYRRGLIK